MKLYQTTLKQAFRSWGVKSHRDPFFASQYITPSHLLLFLGHLVLKISKDNKTDFISISFTHESPYFAYSFLTLLINELNSISRKNDLRKSESALVYLKDQLENTSEVDIRDSINILIESELKVQMYANINENYLITPIDPPYFPEVKSEPTRSIICIIGALIGFLVGLLISLLLPIYSKKNKVETSLK